MVANVAAFAAEGDARTITITSPTGLAATDTTTYHIYKVFNATSDGTSSNINYTKLDGKSLPLTATDNLSKFDADTAGNISYYTRTATTDEWTKVTTAGGSLSTGMIAAISTYVADDNEVGRVTITGPATKATVAVPDYGYYFITTTTGTVVTIDSTNPSASVADKNSVPSIDKKITAVSNGGTVEDDTDKASENDHGDDEVGKGKIGDTVTYSVDIFAKPGAINYIFHDKLASGLTLANQNTLTVKVGGETVAASNYEIKYYSDTDATNQADTEAGDNITIRFKNEYLATITAPTTITVSYQAVINDNAVIAGAGNPNTVVLDYGHDPTADTDEKKKEPTKKTEEDDAVVYTYALGLKKINSSAEALDGATFQLPFYVKATPDATDGAYIYAGTAAGEGLVNTLTTPDSGIILIKGVQNVAYTFEETVAPVGYNKLTASFTITPIVTSKTTTTTSTTIYLDEDGNEVDRETYQGTPITVTYTDDDLVVGGFKAVLNKSGVELPSTGGIGTTILYVGGSILVILAAILLITKRRMNAED